MKKVAPDLFKKLTSVEYKAEFDRIENGIKEMENLDFEIILNTDIPFRCNYFESWKRPFNDLRNQSINTQKEVYVRYLQTIFMFPQSMYQRN